MDGVGWTRTTVDAVVTADRARLWGVVLLTSVTGGDVTVYEGQDTVSGRQIARLEGTADESRPVMFPRPLQCDRGIYVDVGSNVTEVLIVWEPSGREERP